MLDIHTIAAGGGSLCRFDGRKLSVGPDSAGARPGPLCYGLPEATELSLTDVHVALGRLVADRFPFPLDEARVEVALGKLAHAVEPKGDAQRTLRLAEGFFDIAVESMAEAIRRVTIARGHDVRDHALLVFGGAGGQAACAVIDFTGSAKEHEGNLNAPRAVTVAAVLYVLRCLVGKPIPLNSGCLRAIDLTIPEPSILWPGKERAVVAGNVETSQRVVDVLLSALGLAAASQGTMNNLTFGNERFGYYETIAGGAGGTARAAGASAVHTHMTNTRITDAEVLERRFPVRLRKHALRRGSGGHGANPGGDGVVRELLALLPLRVNFLSERRVRPPFGLKGGDPGAKGRNLVDGVEVGGRASVRIEAGSVICIETPGGGGYGKATGGP